VYAATPEVAHIPPDDATVRIYDAAFPPSADVVSMLKKYSGTIAFWLMQRRLMHLGAVLLAVVTQGDLAAYGWIQTWRPHRRQFAWLARDAVCLGPYWTNPRLRGRGLYQQLLAHSVRECQQRFPEKEIYVWSLVSNPASIRGLEKAGFRSLGDHAISAYFFRTVCHHRRVS
jgi:L-amino acid N-acyltransferase YncA